MHNPTCHVISLILPIAIASPALGAEPKWEYLFTEEGIRVSSRDIPGTSLVEFRGTGEISSGILQVAAAIWDHDRKTEWMRNCVGSKLIESRSPKNEIVYNRTGSPVAIVSDRDIVVEGHATIDREKKGLSIKFWEVSHPKMPEVEDVVRMPRLRGHWKITQLSKDKSHMEYQVQADPGGIIPKWIVNWLNRKLPFFTIKNLRTQIKKPGHEKFQKILFGTFDWNGFELSGGFSAPEAKSKTATTAASDPSPK